MDEGKNKENSISDLGNNSLIPPKNVAPMSSAGATKILNQQTPIKNVTDFKTNTNTNLIQTNSIPAQIVAADDDFESGQFSDLQIFSNPEGDEKISSLSNEKRLAIRLLDQGYGSQRYELAFNDDLLDKAEQALKLTSGIKGYYLNIDIDAKEEFFKNLHKVLLEDPNFVRNYVSVIMADYSSIIYRRTDDPNEKITINSGKEFFDIFKRFINFPSDLRYYSYELFLALKDFYEFKSNYKQLDDPYVLYTVKRATLLTTLQNKMLNESLENFDNRVLVNRFTEYVEKLNVPHKDLLVSDLLRSWKYSDLLKDNNFAFMESVSKAQYYLDKFKDYVPSIKSILARPFVAIGRSIEYERARRKEEEEEERERRRKYEIELRQRLNTEPGRYFKFELLRNQRISFDINSLDSYEFWANKIKEQFNKNSSDVSFLATTNLLNKYLNISNEKIADTYPLLFLHLQSYFAYKSNFFLNTPNNFNQNYGLPYVGNFNELAAKKLVEYFDPIEFSQFLKERSPRYLALILYDELRREFNKTGVIDESVVNEAAIRLNYFINSSLDSKSFILLLANAERLNNYWLSERIGLPKDYQNKFTSYGYQNIQETTTDSYINVNEFRLKKFYEMCNLNGDLALSLLARASVNVDPSLLREYKKDLDADKFVDRLLSLPTDSFDNIFEDAKKLLFVDKILKALRGEPQYFGYKSLFIFRKPLDFKIEEYFNSPADYNFSGETIDYLVKNCKSVDQIFDVLTAHTKRIMTREMNNYAFGLGNRVKNVEIRKLLNIVENELVRFLGLDYRIVADLLRTTLHKPGLSVLLQETSSSVISSFLEESGSEKDTPENRALRLQRMLESKISRASYYNEFFDRMGRESAVTFDHHIDAKAIFPFTIDNFRSAASGNYKELKDYFLLSPYMLALIAFSEDPYDDISRLMSSIDYFLNSNEAKIVIPTFAKDKSLPDILNLLASYVWGSTSPRRTTIPTPYGSFKVADLGDQYVASTFFTAFMRKNPVKIILPKVISFENDEKSKRIKYMVRNFNTDDWLAFYYLVLEAEHNAGMPLTLTNEISVDDLLTIVNKIDRNYRDTTHAITVEDYILKTAILLHLMRRLNSEFARRGLLLMRKIEQILSSNNDNK